MPPGRKTVRLPRPNGEGQRELELSLLGAFGLVNGAVPVVLGTGSQRLLAFVALQERPTSRDTIAGTLWPDVSEAQAHASLRSAIWRLEQIARDALEIDVLELDLTQAVKVDYRNSEALAHRLLIFDTMPSERDMSAEAIEALASDLLPDWYEDWAVIEAEDWRQLRMHALESMAERLLEGERFGDAIAAARAAARVDPLRESPHAILIRIHLAEGNQSEALREFREFATLMRDELGVEPTPRLSALVGHLQH
jgi:SARP family transcriptional regulator, regulator of embCAB operon